MSTVATRLKLIREEKGLTQQEVADQAGLVRATLANWEIGRTEPDLDSIKRLAQFYKVSTDWIIHGNKLPIPDDPKYSDLGEITLEEEYARKGLTKDMIRHYLDAAVLAVEEARKIHNKSVK